MRAPSERMPSTYSHPPVIPRLRMDAATTEAPRECGQHPGTDNAAVPWNTRIVSECRNTEKALLRSSSNTPCTHPEKVVGQSSPNAWSIAWSQLDLNHVQSFFWPAERPAFMRARRSSTSKRLFLHLAPPASARPSPNDGKVYVLIACLVAAKFSCSSMFF